MPWTMTAELPGPRDPDLGRGYHAPQQVTVEYSSDGQEPATTVVFEVTNDGVARCTKVCIEAKETGREVRGVDLDLALESMAEEVLTRSVTWVSKPNGHGVVRIRMPGPEEFPRVKQQVSAARAKARRRVVTDDLLREVADVYRSAVGDRRNPTKAVAEYIGKSHRTASDYLQRARERGLLGPAPGRGKAGEQETRD